MECTECGSHVLEEIDGRVFCHECGNSWEAVSLDDDVWSTNLLGVDDFEIQRLIKGKYNDL